MNEKARQLGHVSLVQVQPNGLIIDTPDKTPSGHFYDPTRLAQVEQLSITPLGIDATLPDGEHVLDIHHINHPGKEYDDDDFVCVGFDGDFSLPDIYPDGLSGRARQLEPPDPAQVERRHH